MIALQVAALQRRFGRDDGLADTTAWPKRRRGRNGGVAETGEPRRRFERVDGVADLHHYHHQPATAWLRRRDRYGGAVAPIFIIIIISRQRRG
jgi:hypothetical protein